MAWSIFGARTPIKKRATMTAPDDSVGYNASDLTSRFQAAQKGGSGIKAGSHPEFEVETPLDKLVKFFKGNKKK